MSNTFYTTSKGNSADIAFNNAVNEARKNNHESTGASGSIADKDEYVTFTGPVSYDPDGAKEQAERLMAAKSTALQDAYGPAGCIYIGEGEYLFFGTSFSSD